MSAPPAAPAGSGRALARGLFFGMALSALAWTAVVLVIVAAVE